MYFTLPLNHEMSQRNQLGMCKIIMNVFKNRTKIQTELEHT